MRNAKTDVQSWNEFQKNIFFPSSLRDLKKFMDLKPKSPQVPFESDPTLLGILNQTRKALLLSRLESNPIATTALLAIESLILDLSVDGFSNREIKVEDTN